MGGSEEKDDGAVSLFAGEWTELKKEKEKEDGREKKNERRGVYVCVGAWVSD